MVHALQEAWRILVPQGILIDLRPLSIDAPMEIVTLEKCESAGLVDMSPGIPHDIASDNAINSVICDGTYKNLNTEYFDFAYYWNSVEEMKAYIDDRWKDDVILSDDVVFHAQNLFNKHRMQARVRIRTRMKLGELQKQ